ncbi:MAG: hypothetical protein KGZ85_05225 [Ignavibacterium sp.]|nr:hypothetical protein [Ignavibacterium sp.]
MSKTYIGYDGHYEIEDDGKVIQMFVNSLGEFTGITKIYSDVKKIPNLLDRDKIEYFLQLLKIYKIGAKV